MAVGTALLVMQVLLLMAATLQPAFGDTCRLEVHHSPSVAIDDAASICVLAFAVFFAHKSRALPDAVMARASRYCFIAAGSQFFEGFKLAMRHFAGSCPALTVVPTLLSDATVAIFWTVLTSCTFGLVEDRLRLTEAGFDASLGSQWIRRCRFTCLALDLLIPVPHFVGTVIEIVGLGDLQLHTSSGLRSMYCTPSFSRRMYAHYALNAVAYLAVGIIAFCGFSTVLRSMRGRRVALDSYAARETHWARKVFNLLRWVTLAQCLCNSVWHIVLLILFARARCAFERDDGFKVLNTVFGIVQPILLFAEMGFLLVITGLLLPYHSSAFQLRRPTSGCAPRVARSRSWVRTVDSLAGRGITLEALLDFYEALGGPSGPMPHYNPEVSTTNDIVRQVIIPGSRTADGGGAAYANLLRPESTGAPDVMVTHTWSGLFLDLVAAVVADARGRDEYSGTAARLAAGDSHRLRSWLEKRGILGRTYWICAFSVNQHSCICNSLGDAPDKSSPRHIRWDANRRDSATHEIFTVCTCSQAKYGNESDPAACEVNKFDDMLELLSCRAQDFSQLVVVDRDYHVFERAWCVAELHRAHVMGVSQKVCLQVNCVLDIESSDLTVYKKLARLTVTACQASRPEDKEEILSRIVDTREFDEQLQHVIFGNRGLLARQFRGFGVLEAAARTAFRTARCFTGSFSVDE